MSTKALEKDVDLQRGYVPLAAQQAFHDSEASYRLFSGGFGSGKTKAGCRESIWHSCLFPHSRNMVARLAYRPLQRSTMVTYFGELREMGLHVKKWTTFRKADMELEFWNGAVTIFTNLDDIENFKSQELDTIFIDEGAEVPDAVFELLIPGRLRGTARTNARGTAAGRAWVATNPGASGWLRENFVSPEPRHHEDPDDWAWFHSPTTQNVHNPQGYNDALVKKYKGIWYKRYVEGDWTAFEGQVFPQFDRQTHVLSTDWKAQPKEKNRYTIYEGWDFGWVHPTAVVWIAVHNDYEWPPIVFGEYGASGLNIEENAKAVMKLRHSLGIADWNIWSYGDPVGRNTLQDSGSSFNAEYSKYGIDIVPSERDPVIRGLRLAQHLDETLATADGPYPCIVFNPSCHQTADSISYLRWKPGNSQLSEDAAEKFIKQNDHWFDALTYGLIHAPAPREFTLARSPRIVPKLPAGIALPANYDDANRIITGRWPREADWEQEGESND